VREPVDDAASDRLTGQFALAPVTERQVAFLWRFARQRHDRADLLGGKRRRRARPRCVGQPGHHRGLRRTGQPLRAPVPHRLRPDAEFASDLAHRRCGGRTQDHLGAFSQLARRLVRPGKPLQFFLLRRRQEDRGGGQTGHAQAPANQDEASKRATAISARALTRKKPPGLPPPLTIGAALWQTRLTPSDQPPEGSRHFRRGVLVHLAGKTDLIPALPHAASGLAPTNELPLRYEFCDKS